MLQAELRKLRTTRTSRWLWVIGAVVVVVGDYSTVSATDPSRLTGHLRDQPFHFLSAINLSLIAALIGVRSITDEYRYNTISWTMLLRQHRHRALAAKAVVAGAYGAGVALTAQIVGSALALWVIERRGAALEIDVADLAAVVGLTVACAAWAVLGVAIGTLVRNQVVAVALALVWVLAIENLASAVLGGIARLLPGQAAYALAGATEADGLPPLLGLAVLASYVVVLVGVASADFAGRPLFHNG